MNPKYASQQKKEKFQQFTELERERNIGLREGGFSYSANTSSCAAEQFHSDESLGPTSTERLERPAVDDEDDVRSRRLTPALYGGE